MKKLLFTALVFIVFSSLNCSNPPKKAVSDQEVVHNTISEENTRESLSSNERIEEILNPYLYKIMGDILDKIPEDNIDIIAEDNLDIIAKDNIDKKPEDNVDKIKVAAKNNVTAIKEAPTQSKLTNASYESFGKAVYNALKANNYDKMKPFLPTTKDIEYLRDFEIKNDPSMKNRKKANLLAKLKKLQNNKIEKSKKSFDKIIKKVEDKGIIWKDVKFQKSTFKKDKKKDLEQGDIYIFLNYLGAEYIIEMTNCMKVKRGWIIGDKMNLK